MNYIKKTFYLSQKSSVFYKNFIFLIFSSIINRCDIANMFLLSKLADIESQQFTLLYKTEGSIILEYNYRNPGL